MKEGRYYVRLQAKEDEVYHLMDLKEWFSILIGLGSFFEGIALYFFIWNWNQIALPSASRRKMEDMSPAVFFIRK